MDSLNSFQPNECARFRMRLGVIGHVPHWTAADGSPVAYEPYVREMRIWAELFSEINVCSPRGTGPVRGNVAPYACSNIRWHPVDYTLEPGKALQRLLQLPRLVAAARRTIRQNDFIHLRSPGHFGLVGAVLVRATGRASVTKWAGENGAYEGERLVAAIHRKVESRPSSRNLVLVYGPAKYPHQISFLPALMSTAELTAAHELSVARMWSPPWRILSVGRLVPVKGFDLALRGLTELRRRFADLNWHFTLIGDGPAHKDLETLAVECGIREKVSFTGALSFRQVQDHYAQSHLVIMPGVKEGWSKVIAEAWAHGAIPVAARGGIVPDILRDADSGVVFEPTPEALASALAELLNHPGRMQAMAQGIHRFAAELSLEQFKARLERVLVERCGLK